MQARDALKAIFRTIAPATYEHRHLLFGLVKNNLKGRYNNSALGILWHIINPVMQIVVYALVFSMMFGQSIENYWAYLSIGVFAYNFFSSTLNSGTNAIVSNRGMVTKMYFPREILVYANVLFNLTTFLISYAALICILIVFGIVPDPWLIALLPPFIILEMIFITGVTLAFSAINVFYRDVSYGMQILTMLLMFMTPIFYEADIDGHALEMIIAINPMAHYVGAMHDIIYYGTLPGTAEVVVSVFLALTALLIGKAIFKKLERKFPEKL